MASSRSLLGWLRRRRARDPAAVVPTPRLIEILPVGAARVPAWLADDLRDFFALPCHVGAPLPLRAEWYAEATGQYLSCAIVDALIDRAEAATGEAGVWLLGFADVDLGAETRTFVFGEATVGGCCAVISTARLGIGADAECYRRRVVAEAVHELGHVAGLEHCALSDCVMRPTRTVAEIDRRGARPCAECDHLLRRPARSETGA